MTDLYTTVSEIKAILKISGTAEDYLMEQQNYAATDLLNTILGVSTLKFGTHTDEVITGHGYNFFQTHHYPVANTQASFAIASEDGTDITGIEFLRGEQNVMHLKNNLVRDYKYLLTYDAGYTLYDTVTIDDNASITGAITVKTAYAAAVTRTIGVNVTVGGTATLTAAAFVTAFIAAGINCTSDGAVITFEADHFVTTTISSAKATLLQKTIPNFIRNVIAFLVAGLKSEQNGSPNVASYTIGSKSVTFRSGTEAAYVERVLADFLPGRNFEGYT